MEIQTEISGRLTSSSIDIRVDGVLLSTGLGDLMIPWASLYQMMANPEVAQNLELVEIFKRDIPLDLLYNKT